MKSEKHVKRVENMTNKLMEDSRWGELSLEGIYNGMKSTFYFDVSEAGTDKIYRFDKWVGKCLLKGKDKYFY